LTKIDAFLHETQRYGQSVVPAVDYAAVELRIAAEMGLILSNEQKATPPTKVDERPTAWKHIVKGSDEA
jgi:hypothetical protein